MTHNAFFAPAVFATLTLVTSCARTDTFPHLEGPYLGQEPPGLTPEVFAPGIISVEGQYEGGATFSVDGQFFAYKRDYLPNPEIEKIWISEIRNGRWVEPYLAPFNSDSSDWDFGFARSDNAFYFTSRRPALIDGRAARPSNIWKTEPTPSGWTEPRLLQPPVNLVERGSGMASLTTDGTMYFHSSRKDGMGQVDIVRARLIGGVYATVETVGPPVSTADRELDPCISPDESYLIFLSNRPGGSFDHDLFISFRNADDSWTEPQALGGVLGDAGLPSITADGRYFFFAAGDYTDQDTIQMYWVDTRIFDQFEPEETR